MSEVKGDGSLVFFMLFFPWIAIFCFPLLHYIILKICICMRSEKSKQQKLEDTEMAEQSSDNEPYYTGKDVFIYDITLKRIYSIHCNVWVWLWILYFAITAGAEDDEYPGTRKIGNIYGYILIPLLSLYMYVESFFCLEWKYLGNIMEEKTCRAYIKELTETRPIVIAKVTAFHYETRMRQVPYTIGGNTYYRTEPYQEKVVDDEDFEIFSFTRWDDITPNPETLSLESSKLTRIVLTKNVIFGDEETQEKFNELMAEVEAKVRAESPESQIESIRENDIPGFKERLLAYWECQEPRWWVNKHVFVIASFLLLTWVYRVFFSVVSQKAHVGIEKKIYFREY